jgi:hypothetical protein
LISLKTAQDLKEAGLKWEYRLGDRFWSLYKVGTRLLWKQNMVCDEDIFELCDEDTFAPHLDQLFEEIERRGYGYSLSFKAGRTGIPPYEMHIWAEGFPQEVFLATDCDTAVAKALLWILKEGR